MTRHPIESMRFLTQGLPSARGRGLAGLVRSQILCHLHAGIPFQGSRMADEGHQSMEIISLAREMCF